MASSDLVPVVVSSLAAYLSLAGDSFAKELGKKASEKIGELYKVIKKRFSKEKEDQNIPQILEAFEKKPDEWIGPMKSILAKIISDDPEFSDLLEKLVNESKAESEKSGTVNNFETMVTGGYVGKIFNIGTIKGDLEL